MFQYLNKKKFPIFFPSKSGKAYIKDPESKEKSFKKSNFRFFQFLFFRVMVIFVLKSSQFSKNFHDNLKNKNRKNYFSFVSAHKRIYVNSGREFRNIYSFYLILYFVINSIEFICFFQFCSFPVIYVLHDHPFCSIFLFFVNIMLFPSCHT